MTEAMWFLTSRGAAEAAQGIADKMRQENGVQTAVASLHRQLPLASMGCDVIPSQVARWTLGKRSRRIQLSDLAVAVLVTKKLIKLDDLKVCVPSPHLISDLLPS